MIVNIIENVAVDGSSSASSTSKSWDRTSASGRGVAIQMSRTWASATIRGYTATRSAILAQGFWDHHITIGIAVFLVQVAWAFKLTGRSLSATWSRFRKRGDPHVGAFFEQSWTFTPWELQIPHHQHHRNANKGWQVKQQFVVPHSNSRGTVSFNLAGPRQRQGISALGMWKL